MFFFSRNGRGRRALSVTAVELEMEVAGTHEQLEEEREGEKDSASRGGRGGQEVQDVPRRPMMCRGDEARREHAREPREHLQRLEHPAASSVSKKHKGGRRARALTAYWSLPRTRTFRPCSWACRSEAHVGSQAVQSTDTKI